MAKPLILITAGRQLRAAPRSEMQTTTTGVDIDYINAVIAAGGAPVILPCASDKEAIGSAVEAADGVLLSGGGDIISLAYGEEPHPSSMYQDPVRDEMEQEVVRAALERDLPILGICRGIQMLNVALGGTLVQDVVTQVKDPVKHYAHPLSPTLMHTVDIAPGSVLARVLGATTLPVNSYHHQAAGRIADELKATCWARDGVVEGLESSGGRRILAVQFHPEEVALEHHQFLGLFEWLVREALATRRAVSSNALVNA